MWSTTFVIIISVLEWFRCGLPARCFGWLINIHIVLFIRLQSESHLIWVRIHQAFWPHAWFMCAVMIFFLGQQRGWITYGKTLFIPNWSSTVLNVDDNDCINWLLFMLEAVAENTNRHTSCAVKTYRSISVVYKRLLILTIYCMEMEMCGDLKYIDVI